MLQCDEMKLAPVCPVEGRQPLRTETLHDCSGDTFHGFARTSGAERRSEERYAVRKSLLAVPVFPDGSPDWDHRVPGISVDVSRGGTGLLLDSSVELSTNALVLLLQDFNGTSSSAGLEVRTSRRESKGTVRIGGTFAGFAHELLTAQNLTPTFHLNELRFAAVFSEDVLNRWVQLGVLEPFVWDRVQVCPECSSLITVRQACPACGSARVTNDQLIHHFACAYVGFAHDFERDGDLACPKCRTRALIVGADYEHLTGPYRCQKCHWSDMELECVAQCLRCGLRFHGHQANELELRGYRANRLDPLALVSASGSAPRLAGGPSIAGRPPVRVQQDRDVLVELRT